MKQWVHDQFVVQDLASDDPARLAAHLTLILESAYASVQALGITGPANDARSLVETLI